MGGRVFIFYTLQAEYTVYKETAVYRVNKQCAQRLKGDNLPLYTILLLVYDCELVKTLQKIYFSHF